MVSSAVASPQADAVPEFYPYEDTGCEVAASCLNCPLPQCRYDDPAWYYKNRRLAKDFKVFAVIENEQLSVGEAADRFSVTIRTIFRIMQRCREATNNGANHQELGLFAA